MLFMMVCEDASHLGGPMGTEYTTHIFSKVFRSVKAAKLCAEKYRTEKTGGTVTDWRKNGDLHYWDAGMFIFRITSLTVEGGVK
jgi:plasmid replication initiation protein